MALNVDKAILLVLCEPSLGLLYPYQQILSIPNGLGIKRGLQFGALFNNEVG